MIESMTGYGKAEALLEKGRLTVEIRTLNGKNAEVSLKTALLPRDKELLVRQKLAGRLKRGTIDFFLTFGSRAGRPAKRIDAAVLKDYYFQLSALRREVGDEGDAPLWSALLGLPDVIENGQEEGIEEKDWPKVEAAIDRAVGKVEEYRRREGAALYKDIISKLERILTLEDEVEALEEERLSLVRQRLQKHLADLKAAPDPERFEQELIYYLEKLDINEEKVRLRQHCRYFRETIDREEAPGRKLGFILQEMGREINTTGSKANHAGIQKIVVKMKDELEKIREQSLNVL